MNDRVPELRIELKTGKLVRLSLEGLSNDDGLLVAVAQRIDGWKRAGTCMGVPAPGWTNAEVVVIPWDSVDWAGLFL